MPTTLGFVILEDCCGSAYDSFIFTVLFYKDSFPGSAGSYVKWIQLLWISDPVQFSCVLESADQNSGLAPYNSTPLW